MTFTLPASSLLAIPQRPLESSFEPSSRQVVHSASFPERGRVVPELREPAVRELFISEVEALDPDVPVADVRLMGDYVADAMAQARFTLTLIVVFAVLALTLASIGLYGVISYSLRQRIQEFGVRMAFGADAASILRLVVSHAMVLSLAGVGAGLLFALAVTRMASSLLFGVTPTDPVTFVGIPVLLVGITTLASYIPARRATRIDPLHALRGESR